MDEIRKALIYGIENPPREYTVEEWHVVAEFAHYVVSNYEKYRNNMDIYKTIKGEARYEPSFDGFEPITSDGFKLKPKAEITLEEYEKLKKIIKQNTPEVKIVDVEFHCLDCKYKDTSATEEPCNCCYGGSHFVKLED